MLLAHDTEVRLQKEGLTKSNGLEEWIVEAGPDYFNETVTAVEKAIQQTNAALKDRKVQPYIQSK
jgi:hypothetical protein